MGSFLYHQFLVLGLFLTALLISPVYGQTCKSQTFISNAQFTNCTDLPSLKSFLHWSYSPTNKNLSVAFIAPPPKSSGWVAWAINPTGTGMVGCQALLAYKASNGSMLVKTFNISSYSSIKESKLSFGVLDKKAEYSDGMIRIYATLALPENMTTLNQVWQVGSALKNGFPEVHAFKPENLNAKGTLELVAGSAAAPSPAPGGSGDENTTTGGRGPSRDASGGCGMSLHSGFYGFFLLIGILFLVY